MSATKQNQNSENTVVLQIGVDEVGRGPLFGRVYAAAVILPVANSEKGQSFDFHRMKDSKKFHSTKKLKETADYIRQNAIAYHISWRDEKHIDKVNILQATQDAMHEAIEAIITGEWQDNSQAFKLAIDGNYFRPFTDPRTGKFVAHECIIKGDATHPAIAAASIIAKVARDQYIIDLCNEFPELITKYDLEKNKGYGTAKHRKGIQENGLTEWHRLREPTVPL